MLDETIVVGSLGAEKPKLKNFHIRRHWKSCICMYAGKLSFLEQFHATQIAII